MRVSVCVCERECKYGIDVWGECPLNGAVCQPARPFEAKWEAT